MGLGAVTDLLRRAGVTRQPTLFATAADGLVEVVGDELRRWLRPPAAVDVVVVSCRNAWQRGLDAASRFAPMAAKVALFRRLPKGAVLHEADYWGIGVWVGTIGAHDVVVPPEPYQRRYWKPAGWRFAENAYGPWLRQSTEAIR